MQAMAALVFHHVFAVQKDEFPEAQLRCQACLLGIIITF